MPTLSLRRVFDHLAYRFVRAPRGGGKPVPQAAFDAEYASGHWDSFFGTDEAPRYEALARRIRAAASRPRLLDVGCGSGRLATLFAPGELQGYLGLDLSREGLRRAEGLRLPGARFEYGDFETWRPEPEAWDVIVFNEVVGYARDPARVVGEFAGRLPSGGSIAISYLRYGNWEPIWRRIEKRLAVTAAEVVHGPKGVVWDLKMLKPPTTTR